MFEGAPEIVIQGITETGETFRQSDWAACSRYSARMVAYSPFLKPVIAGGMRYVA